MKKILSFLVVGILVLTSLAVCVGASASVKDTAMNKKVQKIDKSQISVQLFSARKYSGSKEDIDMMLGKLHDIGYSAVELGGFWNLTGSEWKELLDKHHLKLSSVHVYKSDFSDGAKKLIQNMKELGCKTAIYAWIGNTNVDDESGVQTYIQNLINYKKILAAEGIDLLYHNHNIEFVKAKNGQTVYDQILAGTKMNAELDIHWTARAGVSVPKKIEKLGKKLEYIHLKDLGVGKVLSDPNNPTSRQTLFEELGQGNLDMDGIMKAAMDAGNKWYVIEQDNDFINDDPLESLKISYDYLYNNFCKK